MEEAVSVVPPLLDFQPGGGELVHVGHQLIIYVAGLVHAEPLHRI